MMSLFDRFFPWFGDMAEMGGDILLLILFVAAILFALVFERIVFLWWEFPRDLRQAQRQWHARSDHHSWFAQQFRQRLLLHCSWGLKRYFSLIRVLIALAPLLGLLGTVLGMLEVFEGMATTGNNNPRSTAAGVSKATITTMAGMVVAIAGMLTLTLIERRASREQLRTNQLLSFELRGEVSGAPISQQ